MVIFIQLGGRHQCIERETYKSVVKIECFSKFVKEIHETGKIDNSDKVKQRIQIS